MAETPYAIALEQVHEPPPLPSVRNASVGPAVEQTLLIVLAKEPQQRFASCSAFMVALSEAAGAQMVPTEPQPGYTPRPAMFESMPPIAAPAEQGSSAQREPSTPAPALAPAAGTSPGSGRRSRRIGMVLAVGVLLLAVVGGAAFALLRGDKHAGSSEAASASAAAQSSGRAARGGGPLPASSGSPGVGTPLQVILGAQLSNDWKNDSDAARATVQLRSTMQHGGHPAVRSHARPLCRPALASPGVPTNRYTHLRLFLHAGSRAASRPLPHRRGRRSVSARHLACLASGRAQR